MLYVRQRLKCDAVLGQTHGQTLSAQHRNRLTCESTLRGIPSWGGVLKQHLLDVGNFEFAH